jgi:MerR family transcriptional regulator, copper efflux regulator
MLISEFARTVGLSVDTVRFYIRRGLLTPETNGKGASNPYQHFSAEHVTTARNIRFAQSMGMSLKEIAAINAEHQRGHITPERSIEIMTDQVVLIEQKMAELNAMDYYLRAKIKWMLGGRLGPAPTLRAD